MQPDLIITPFGENAAPGTIEPIPETLGPGDPVQQASWNAGFPAVTMTPLAAGGIPPRGQDFNGVLKAISEHTVFVGGGGQYKWDAIFAADDGYPLGAQVQKAGNDGFWLNLVDGNTTDPDAAGAGWIDAVNSTLPYALDTGAANAYVATFVPALSAPTNGQVVRIKAANANTGASTFNGKPIVTLNGAAISAGAIVAGGHVWLQYDTGIGLGSWVSLLISGSVDTINAAIATVAAAGTINLTAGAPNTSQLLISGTGVTINGFTVAANRYFIAKIAGANTLVNSASLVTNTGANIVTEANDSVLLRSTAANTVEVVAYFSRIPLASGFAQTTQNLTGSRLSNTVYTNTTKRPIKVYVSTIYGAAVSILRVDGVQAGIAGGNGTSALSTASVTVPPGSTYEFASGGVPLFWSELR